MGVRLVTKRNIYLVRHGNCHIIYLSPYRQSKQFFVIVRHDAHPTYTPDVTYPILLNTSVQATDVGVPCLALSLRSITLTHEGKREKNPRWLIDGGLPSSIVLSLALTVDGRRAELPSFHAQPFS